MKKKYDIFISYRRVGGFESANLIAEKLRYMGYSVFFDVESLRSGRFNDQLYGVIEECKDFIVVLPEKGLDRCSNADGGVNEDDWIRKEVAHAMKKNKNIVPVMLAGFEWPKPMPTGMEELKEFQSVTATSHEVFDLAMQRLAGYMKSKPHRFKLLKLLGAVLVVLAAITAIGYFALLQFAKPICTSVANEFSAGLGLVHEARQDEDILVRSWNAFLHNYSIAHTINRKTDLESGLIEMLNHTKDNTSKLRKRIRPSMNLSDWQLLLLGLYGSQKEDIEALPAFVESYMDDLDSLVCVMDRVVAKHMYKSYETENVKFNIQFYEASVDVIYYSYLQELTKLPVGCRKMHDNLSNKWTFFPNVSLSLSQAEYERLQNKELAKMENFATKMEQSISVQENEIYEFGQRLDTLDAIAIAFSEANSLVSDNKEEILNAVKERVNVKRELVEQKKAELAEETSEMKRYYELLKQNCTLKADDSEGYQWGKIIRFAKYLQINVDEYKQFGTMAIIKPMAVYHDLCVQLDAFQRFHPEAKSFIPSVKQYYKQIAEGKRKLGGQLIFAFKDNAIHPIYKVGDIIVSRNGKLITDNASLANAVSVNKQGNVEVLRLVNGSLQLHQMDVPESNILVGYMEVGEY